MNGINDRLITQTLKKHLKNFVNFLKILSLIWASLMAVEAIRKQLKMLIENF